MAISIGIPTDTEEVIIYDFQKQFEETIIRLFSGISDNQWLPHVTSNQENDKGDVIVNGSTVFSINDYHIHVRVFFDPLETAYEYKGREINTHWFSMDTGAARTTVGYLLLAILAILISKNAQGIIEDPAKFWIDHEISTVEDFTERLTVKEEIDKSNSKFFADIFFSRLNANRK